VATGAKRSSRSAAAVANFSLWPHLASCPETLWRTVSNFVSELVSHSISDFIASR
jgi:hypothetical protein